MSEQGILTLAFMLCVLVGALAFLFLLYKELNK